ncbi:MAG: hypothetical protein AAGE89_01895 [Pseudomonadota bacterium]
MKAITFSFILIALVTLPSEAKHGRNAAKGLAIGAALLGAAALAASSHDHRHQNYRPHRDYRPRRHGPFSPARHITCYPREQACYRDNGRYSWNWTNRIYR